MAAALVQLDSGIRKECRAFSTVLGSSVVQIVVTASTNSASAAKDAGILFDELCALLIRSGARPELPRCHGSFSPGAYGCWASHHPGSVRRVFVWVSDALGSAPVIPSASGTVAWDALLACFPVGTPANIIKASAGTWLAAQYPPGRIQDLLPDVLRAAAIVMDAFRLFISYVWEDAKAVAGQLFDALAHAQFDVYLDRFRTDPGTDFQERIRAELLDKSCVLLLDSRDVGSSSWVRGEYATARLYRLGLMAVDLPGGTRTFPRIGTRFDLRGASAPGSFSKSTTLSDADIQGVVDGVRQKYFIEVSRRIRHQRRIILAGAKLAGISVTQQMDGSYGYSHATKDYFLTASARPPQITPFRTVGQAAAAVKPRPATGVVIGPLMGYTHQGREDIDWLAYRTDSAAVDEAKLFAAMRQVAAGTL
jgi:TIR domain-containing protein